MSLQNDIRVAKQESKDLAFWLAFNRRMTGLTVNALANLSGVSRRTIDRIEAGNVITYSPGTEILERLQTQFNQILQTNQPSQSA